MSATQEILNGYQHVISSLNLVTGSKGIFDVHVDGDLIFSKHVEGRIPQRGRVARPGGSHRWPRRCPLRNLSGDLTDKEASARNPVHPNLIRVDDPADPRIEVYQGLRDHVLRQRREEPGGDMDGVFMSEGDIVVERALKAGYKLSSILIDGKRTKPLPPAVGPEVPVYAAGVSVLQRVTGYHLHRGMLACFARRPVPTSNEVLANSKNLLVTESIANPTNLGVIIRMLLASASTVMS